MRHVRRKKDCQTLLNGENAANLIIELMLQETRSGCVAIDRPCWPLYSSCPPDDRVYFEWKQMIAVGEIAVIVSWHLE